MTTTLSLFWNLSSNSRKERIGSSVKLISALQQFQAQHVPNDDPSSSEEENQEVKSDGLDILNAQDISYSIRRLVRGLASPRESSRLGFAVALTELLSRIDSVTCSQILSLILDSSKTQGSMSGQEERDMLFARLFGFTAVIQSGLLVQTKPLPASASSDALPSTLASYQELLNQLLALAEKKSWLRESVWWTLGLAIDALHGSDVSWKNTATDYTIDSILSKGWSPEKIALVLKLERLYPARDWQSLLSPVFKNSNLLVTSNMPALARILKDSSVDDGQSQDTSKVAPGSWKPQLHFVWDVMLDSLLPTAGAEKLSTPLPEFFRIVVDESLFASTASQERKFWGFQVFQKALPRVTESTMPMLFTKNFMRTWINHLSKQDRYLHKIAIQTANEIQSFAQKNPRLGFSLILQLTGLNGSQQFDRLTKTKTVETILTSMDNDGIKSYIDLLLKQINDFEGIDSSDFKAINARRSWIIEQLGIVIKNVSIPKSDDWVQMILDWLIGHGLFLVKKKSTRSSYRVLHSIPKPPFSDDLRQTCRHRLLTCLSDLMNRTVATGAADSLSKALKTVDAFENDPEHFSVLFESEESVKELFAKARGIVTKLSNVSKDQQEAAKGAAILIESTILKLRCIEERSDADIHVLEACIDGGTRVSLPGKKKRRKSTSDEEQDLPIDVLVDVIIGFLEDATGFTRTVANSAFSLLSGIVQPSTVDLILAQLQRRSPNELLEGVDEEDEEDEDIEEEISDGESSASSSEHGSSSEDDDADQEVDEELIQKVRAALGVNGDEENEHSEDEELMDDDQMMAIDEKLAEVFKSRTNDRQSKKVNAQREATHFKNRILDLVDLFIKRQPSSPLVIRFILPLVDLVATSSADERQLSDKAQAILRARIAKAKAYPSGVQAEDMASMLSDLHKRASRVHTSGQLALFSLCSVYMAKVMQQSQTDGSLIPVYQASLADFLTRKNSSFNAPFFQDFIHRFPVAGWSLRNDLITLSPKTVNVYRRCQAFQILQTLIPQSNTDQHPVDEVYDFMRSLESALLDVLEKGSSESITLNASQAKNLLKVALLSARRAQSVAPNTWKPQAWRALGNAFASSPRFKTLQTTCNQIADATSDTQASLKGSAKRSADVLEHDVAGSKIKRTKIMTK